MVQGQDFWSQGQGGGLALAPSGCSASSNPCIWYKTVLLALVALPQGIHGGMYRHDGHLVSVVRVGAGVLQSLSAAAMPAPTLLPPLLFKGQQGWGEQACCLLLRVPHVLGCPNLPL